MTSSFTTTVAGILVASIFGLSFLFTKQALDFLQPIDLIGIRFALAATVMTALVALKILRIDLRNGRWLRLIPLAILQPVIYFLCETMGIKLTSASEAGMVIGSTPVIVTLLAAFFIQERPTLAQVLCIVFSSVGVAVMVAGNGLGNPGHIGGLFFLIGAVLSSAFYTILSRRLSAEYSPFEITFVMIWTGTVIFNGLAFIYHGMTFAPFLKGLNHITPWISLIYLGIVSSVVAFFLMNLLLNRVEASRSSAFINLTTVVSVLAGLIFLGEKIRPYQFIGGLMILFGVWGTNRFVHKSSS